MTNYEMKIAIKDEGWTRRKEMVRGGEYAVSDVERTVTVSADGRFKIFPCGTMTTSKTNGVRGDRYLRWSWKGYALRDTEVDKAYNASEDYTAIRSPYTGWTRTVSGLKEAVAKFRVEGW